MKAQNKARANLSAPGRSRPPKWALISPLAPISVAIILSLPVTLSLSTSATSAPNNSTSREQQQQQQANLLTNRFARAVGAARQMADVVAIKEGADLDLSCPIVVQNEDMIISWTCDDELANIKSSRIHVTESGKLRIRSAKVGDSCNYRCEAADGYGTLSVIIKVIIVDKKMMEQLARQQHNNNQSSSPPNQSPGQHSRPASISGGLRTTAQQQLLLQPSLPQTPDAQRAHKVLFQVPTPLKPQQIDSKSVQPDKHGDDNFGPEQNRTRGEGSGGSGGGGGGSAPNTVDNELQSESFKAAALNEVRDRENLELEQQQQQQQQHLEVQVEPAAIRVHRNQTFTLECRVKHAAHFMAPQIIWLKEFIGHKPRSLNEAHEQNLVLIDGVYYHSLNWPRSITQSRKQHHSTYTTSSAVLVRQSKFVHSGRYVCFAGWLPYTMSSNLSSSSVEQIQPTIGNGTSSFRNDFSTRSLLKYEIATALVSVDDAEGAERHKLAFEALGDTLELRAESEAKFQQQQQTQQRPGVGQPKNLLISVLSSNSWTRNLTLVLLLLCGLLFAMKLIYARLILATNRSNHRHKGLAVHGMANNNNSSRLNNANVSNNNNNNNNDNGNLSSSPHTCLAIKRLQQYSKQHRDHYQQPTQQTSIPTDAQLSRQGGSNQNCSVELLGHREVDHVYSEIGEQDKMLITTASEDNYKIPNLHNIEPPNHVGPELPPISHSICPTQTS